MITDLIINIFCFVPNILLDGMEGINLSIPNDIFEGFNSILGCLGFLFPVRGLLIILGISFSIKSFQIVWAIVIRVKSFIPTMGA